MQIEAEVTVEEARLLVRLANVEALKRKLGDSEVIPYAKLLRACEEAGAFGHRLGPPRLTSCFVVVNNMQRCIYVIPNSSVFPRDAISRMEKNSTTSDSSTSLRATLHDLASGLKSEIADKLSDFNVSNFVMTSVKDPVLLADLRGQLV
ncbi:hypothetical protein GUJ93_ZPchr0011g26909 [Zizania palustris]|uniref:Uncharacterized protein n=1 Tax=Zizania palustris TaxID=103762 RepID=A0A8J5WI38_ZIZPA|nr:hypothetical protein GUJ93_ZPchr0011g26909 [Zizania palustris]